MTTPETERRRSKRFPTDTAVSLKTHGGVEQKCATRDMSAGGVFLYCDLKIAQDSPIQLVMVLPPELTGGDTQWVCCEGQVVRVEEAGSGRCGAAVKIEKLSFLPEVTG